MYNKDAFDLKVAAEKAVSAMTVEEVCRLAVWKWMEVHAPRGVGKKSIRSTLDKKV